MVLNGGRTTGAELRRIRLAERPDARGELLIAEERTHWSFPVTRVEWVTAVGAEGATAALDDDRATFVFPLRGTIDVVLTEGSREIITLAEPANALEMPADRRASIRLGAQATACVVAGRFGSTRDAEPVASSASELRVRGCAVQQLRLTTAGGVRRVGLDVERELPFDVRRIYALHSVRDGVMRGAHAHRRLQQLLVAARGRFEIEVDDGMRRERLCLDDPSAGVLIRGVVWRDLGAFSHDAVCLVLCSAPYDESDYIRDYDTFQRAVS